ncbi:DNA-directed RNA polymerase III subunit rpc6 [Ophiocordyceps camponoti-floridani]|uniref:DNA-directed RNA polymerase III subunit RPC6 n=1 Tax=Ophiocordyceps camponoti-floridani TaxID=2030778 RepID=A0A8H4QAX7_9HYPO|nr:DNA-directed RNA polymerase III subunit rpc6 [Ophiocordyceps camponoti-floridani]
MAPAAAPPPGPCPEGEAGKLAVLKEMLYERCKEAGPDNDLFSQDDLLRLDVIPNRDLLLLARVVQSLSDDRLFITMREASGQVLWKWRDAQEAHKYKQCTTDEQVMVYSLIDDSGGDGIWSQTLLRRLNMHDSVLKNAIKQLQAKGLVAPFKNVEHPNKKMYIKASIRPSDRATGGPWYTDQNLDEAFIEDLQRVVFDFIKRQSGYLSTHALKAPRKGVVKGGVDQRGKKRPAAEISSSSTGPSSKPPRREATLLPLPAGYTGYLTVRDIARQLSTNGITTNTILSEEDVKKLVDVLVWDNLVEPVKMAGKLGYRVVGIARQSAESWAGDPSSSSAAAQAASSDSGPRPRVSPLTEAPCGRCPVFDLCEDGGPVGPGNWGVI